MKPFIRFDVYLCVTKRALQNQMCEEKRCKICLIEAGNVVNSGAMDKFSNEKQTNFRLLICANGFAKPSNNRLTNSSCPSNKH